MLKEYVCGALDELTAVEFERHLDQCSSCQGRVDEQSHDTLLRSLRHPPAEISANDQTALNRLIDRAQRVPPASAETEDAAPVPPETVSLEVFVACIQKCGLINPSEVELLLEENRATDSESFAKLLVGRRKLTRFQAKMLVRGRWKGLILGNYILLEKLGQGGMGAVFKARHRRMSRDVCLKVLHASHRKSRGILERFRREAKTVAALQHPNIVVAHDADEAEGVPFLVMEYIQGNDLAQRVSRSGPLPATDALRVVLQTARALDYAHRRGVIHRDIKPHNLLVDETGSVKILDMGLARFDSYVSQNSDATTQASMTISGVIMGTVDYMAPEQALNSRRADHRSDIYSLGCTLHFLLTGKVLFAGDTLMEKLVAHREQPAPSLRDACPDVSEGLDAVFLRMVAKEPGQRYASMAELVQDFEALQNGRRPRALALRALASRLRTYGAIAALAVVAGTIGLSLWLNRSPSSQPDQRQSVNRPIVAAPPAPLSEPPAAPRTALKRIGHPQIQANGGPGRAMVVLAHDWFIEDSYTFTHKALQSRGIAVAVASTKPGSAKPKHDAIAPVAVEMTLDKFDVNDFDAVLFVAGNPYEFTKNQYQAECVRRIVTDCLDKGKPVAAMEVGSLILDELGFSGKAGFEQKGGCWIGRTPGRTGLLVTTKDHKNADEFVQAIFDAQGVAAKSPDK